MWKFNFEKTFYINAHHTWTYVKNTFTETHDDFFAEEESVRCSHVDSYAGFRMHVYTHPTVTWDLVTYMDRKRFMQVRVFKAKDYYDSSDFFSDCARMFIRKLAVFSNQSRFMFLTDKCPVMELVKTLSILQVATHLLETGAVMGTSMANDILMYASSENIVSFVVPALDNYSRHVLAQEIVSRKLIDRFPVIQAIAEQGPVKLFEGSLYDLEPYPEFLRSIHTSGVTEHPSEHLFFLESVLGHVPSETGCANYTFRKIFCVLYANTCLVNTNECFRKKITDIIVDYARCGC